MLVSERRTDCLKKSGMRCKEAINYFLRKSASFPIDEEKNGSSELQTTDNKSFYLKYF